MTKTNPTWDDFLTLIDAKVAKHKAEISARESFARDIPIAVAKAFSAPSDRVRVLVLPGGLENDLRVSIEFLRPDGEAFASAYARVFTRCDRDGLTATIGDTAVPALGPTYDEVIALMLEDAFATLTNRSPSSIARETANLRKLARPDAATSERDCICRV